MNTTTTTTMNTTTTPETTKVRPLMGCYLAVVLEALERYHATDEVLNRGLDNSTLVLAWTGPGLSVPRYCGPDGNIDRDRAGGKWAERIVCALARQAGAYAFDGLDISSSDCWWLIAKIRAGALQVITIDTLQAIRGQQLVEA